MPLFLYQSVIVILLFVFIISHFHNFSSHHNHTTLEPYTTQKHHHAVFGCTSRSNVKSTNGVDCWRIEKGLARSRKALREAARTKIYHNLYSNKIIDNTTFIPRGSIYRNLYAFHQLLNSHTRSNPKLFRNLIKVLRNANTSQGFQPARDVTLPEINIFYNSLMPPMNLGLSPINRSIFVFFVGGHHGHVRETLFRYWNNNKDKDVQVLESLSKDQNYYELMGNSKFCLCSSGYEVASPRLVESIVMGCVPVIISFSDILDWSKFSVSIPLDRIHEMKNILKTIRMNKYLEKQKIVMQLQPHFLLHRSTSSTV